MDSNVIKPRFPIGSIVSVPSQLCTGQVMLYKQWPRPIYFLDLSPGAVSGYEYIWLTHPTQGGSYCCPGNWFDEMFLKMPRT